MGALQNRAKVRSFYYQLGRSCNASSPQKAYFQHSSDSPLITNL